MAYNLTAVGTPTYATSATGFGQGVVLNGSTQYLSLPEPGPADFGSTASWTIECRVKTSTATGTLVAVGQTETSGGVNAWYLGVASGKGAASVSGIVTGSFGAGPTISDGAWHSLALVVAGGTSATLYVDGTSLGTVTGTFVPPTAANVRASYIGGWNASSVYFSGSIDEVRFSRIARYTANYTPATAPFVSDANTTALYHLDNAATDNNLIGNVVCAGNSLTFGDTLDARQPNANRATQSYPAQLAAILPSGYTVSNQGWGGQDALQLNDPTWAGSTVAAGSGYVNAVDALYSAANPSNTLVFFEGINGIAHAVRPSLASPYPAYSGKPDVQSSTLSVATVAAAVFAQLTAYCASRRGVGWKVIVGTCPFGYVAPDLSNILATPSGLVDPALPIFVEQCRTAYNALVRSSWATFADGFIDIGALPPFTGSADALGDTSNATQIGVYYYRDSLHYTPTGYALLAGAVARAITALSSHGYYPVTPSDLSVALSTVGLTASTPYTPSPPTPGNAAVTAANASLSLSSEGKTSITIPLKPGDTRPVVVTINDATFTYTRGVTYSVPNDVYTLLRNNGTI